MEEEDLDLRYDYICLCCGGRNGELLPECSLNRFPMERDAIGLAALPDWYAEQDFDYELWYNSPYYCGSLIIPSGYFLMPYERERLLQAAEFHLRLRDPGPMFFTWGVDDDDDWPFLELKAVLH